MFIFYNMGNKSTIMQYCYFSIMPKPAYLCVCSIDVHYHFFIFLPLFLCVFYSYAFLVGFCSGWLILTSNLFLIYTGFITLF